MTPADPQHIHALREQLLDQLAEALHEDWLWAYGSHPVTQGYRPDADQAGRRALSNRALAMLVRRAVRSGDTVWPGKALQRFKDATNMTDRVGALDALANAHSDLADAALQRFYDHFRSEALVVDLSEYGRTPPGAAGATSQQQPGAPISPNAIANAAGAATQPLNADERFAQKFSADPTRPARATTMGNLSTTVVEGAIIPAVLETGLNSDLPGYVRAVVTREVEEVTS